MSTITVLLAPDGPAAGVPDALADLSAAGLLDPFAWVTASQMESSAISAAVFDGGRRTGVSLQRWIAEHGSGDVRRIRVVVIVPLGGAEMVPAELEQRLYDAVLSGGGSSPITPIRCLVARPGAQAPTNAVARSGWHNVLISPEDADGPGRFRVDLWPNEDQVEIGRYAGPVVAGVAALWTGVDHCALDDDNSTTPPRVRAARAFYRRIDADAIEAELRARVLATGDPLPLPRDHLGATEFVENRAQACSDMADALWRRHRDKLVGPRERPAKSPVLETGAWAAITMLLSYIWSALTQAPGAWLDARRNQAAEMAARRTHQMVFGDGETDYEVVVQGIDRNGLPASWRDLGEAYHRVDERLAGSAEERNRARVRPDLRPLWDDFVAGALTLVDAGDHNDMPPATVGANRAIVRSVVDCAPDPGQSFGAILPHIEEATSVSGVAPGDVLLGMSLHQKLTSPALMAKFGQDAGRTSHELVEWAAKHDSTYSAQVGRRIADDVFRVIEEIKHYLELLYRIGEEQNRPGPATRPRWVVWVLSVLAVAGLVAGPVLGVQDVVNPVFATVIAVVPAVVWIGYMLVEFAKARREAFRDQHRRRTLLDEATAAQLNLGQAIIDLQRLSDAYDQYRVWNTILGVVLRRPFGVRTGGEDLLPGPARGLPLSTGIARARIDEEPLGRAVAALRTEVFPRGWLGRLWDQHLRGAATRMRHYELMNRGPAEIVDLRGVAVHESALAQWADLLSRQDSDTRVGDAVWANVLRDLDRRPDGLGPGLLSAVHGVDESDRTPVDLSRFMAGIDEPRPGVHERFTKTIFTATALAQEHTKIEIHDPRSVPLGLSRVATLVQMGEPWPPEDFAVTASSRSDHQKGPVVPPPMPGGPAEAPADRARGVPQQGAHAAGTEPKRSRAVEPDPVGSGPGEPGPVDGELATPPSGVPVAGGSGRAAPTAAHRRDLPPAGPPGFR